MKASTKSIHAKLYIFTFFDYYLPKNLCPYFWKLIFAGIVFIPNFILQFPALIRCKFNISNEGAKDRMILGVALWAAIGLAYGYLFTTFHLIKYIFNAYSYTNKIAEIGGALNGIILFAFVFYWFIEWKDKRKERRQNLIIEPTPNIFIEFIKAKYNKYCPTIEWDKSDVEEDNLQEA